MRAADQLRKDARRNREAILEAARELFAVSADVAMRDVARRAGVGQGTLYRNFPNCSALAAEIIGEQVDRIAELAADHADDPNAFFVLLQRLVVGMVDLYALADLARADDRADALLERDRMRVAELMRRPLQDAQAAGTLRPDLTLDDVFLLLRMARGAMDRTPDAAARTAAAERLLTLTLGGIALTGDVPERTSPDSRRGRARQATRRM